MRLEQLLRVRDLSVRSSILARLPDDRRAEMAALLDAAFSEGDAIWAQEHLPTILGKEQANRVLNVKIEPPGLGAEP